MMKCLSQSFSNPLQLGVTWPLSGTPFSGRFTRAKMPTSGSRIKFRMTIGQLGCEGIVS